MANSLRRNPDQDAVPQPRRHDAFYLLVGFTLVCLGIVLGLFSGLPNCHRAFAMKSFPRELSLVQLQTEGLDDNAFIQLTDVDFDRLTPPSPLEKVTSTLSQLSSPVELGSDPDQLGNKLATIRQELFGTLESTSVGPLLAESFRGIPLFPKGESSLQTEPIVTLSRHSATLESAKQQIDNRNELRGFLSLDTRGDMIRMLETFSNVGEIDPRSNESLAASKQADRSSKDAAPTYRLEPLETPPARLQASVLLAVSVLTFATGMVLCGSSSLSFWTCLLMPIPAAISVLGMPMRCGRGGRKMRFIYNFVGVGFLILGGYEMAVLGGFGQVGGNSIHAVVGCLILAIGIAAVLGTIIHARTPKPTVIPAIAMPQPETARLPHILRYNSNSNSHEREADHESHPSPPRNPQPTAYEDPVLIAAMDDSCSSLTMEYINRVMELDFSNPAFVRDKSLSSLTSIGLLLGCNNTVLADISDDTVHPTIRLTSVLQDGLPVITSSETISQGDQPKMATTGVYQTVPALPLTSMLAKHLQQTIQMSEKRECQIVKIDRDEKYEVYLLSLRASADVQSQYDESNLTVAPATYERFHFPPQPIEELVASS
ncbi:hypothetical protein Pla52o_26970 [Novipirellula galeiformis]|uniref:Transmembrane protein n=1 Tax=Novipirellula galeiformis TaxID=2528004 RepID=A0A5C6CG58_9BACT|nr:hypothetical protein [Novipirellula galeiformis]TWU23162.1 hypothetical protein Pla52o_26970 [Novipirellula galeiformis]